ncbi:hypothetical protein M8R20_38905 [Pseudomonas sp. R2.Fl]|nr:hypothetical protein [Pseudomonas sp. R2.Fl]
MSWIWAVLIAVWLMLNFVASARVLGDADMPRSRRVAQLALVWLAPVLGAVLCLAFRATVTLGDKPFMERTAFANNADATGQEVSGASGSGFDGCSGGGDGGCSN